jgi:DNA invertase Pin-like site-specific DNA recombinase
VGGNAWTCAVDKKGQIDGINCRTTLLDTAMSLAVYLRVSTTQQSVDQQHDLIAAAGVVPDRVFTDTASGRAGSNRPGWSECIGWLREGDQLVVVAVDRLGRSVREVATALHELSARGVHVRSLREGVDTSTPTGRAVVSIMASIAELELELGKERRAASREARVARGLAATKPMKLDAAQQKRLLRLYQQGEPVSELTSMFGICRSTLFRTLKVLKEQESLAGTTR